MPDKNNSFLEKKPFSPEIALRERMKSCEWSAKQMP